LRVLGLQRLGLGCGCPARAPVSHREHAAIGWVDHDGQTHGLYVDVMPVFVGDVTGSLVDLDARCSDRRLALLASKSQRVFRLVPTVGTVGTKGARINYWLVEPGA
jgi:hypothetical protein